MLDCVTAAQVVRVRTRETIADYRIRDLIRRAVAATRYPGTTPQAFYDEIADGIAGDMLGVFVASEGGRWPMALAIVTLPWSAVMMAPCINLAYSESRALSLMLGERVRDWVKRMGFDRIMGINLYHDDEAFCRAFRHVGETSVIGSLVEARI